MALGHPRHRHRHRPLAWRTRLEERLVAYIVELPFHNHYRTFVHGPPERVHDERGRRHGRILNTRSGEIRLAEGVVIGHTAMLITGRHEFEGGRFLPEDEQVPEQGHDINVGGGSWIASAGNRARQGDDR